MSLTGVADNKFRTIHSQSPTVSSSTLYYKTVPWLWALYSDTSTNTMSRAHTPAGLGSPKSFSLGSKLASELNKLLRINESTRLVGYQPGLGPKAIKRRVAAQLN